MAETLPPAFDSWFQAKSPDIPVSAARAVLERAAGGASAAFIACYRRDHTGGLDAKAGRRVLEAGELLAKICSRQTIMLESIERHATLEPELRERILASFDLGAESLDLGGQAPGVEPGRLQVVGERVHVAGDLRGATRSGWDDLAS